MLAELFSDPRAFFEGQESELRGPLVAVGVVGVVAVLDELFWYLLVQDALDILSHSVTGFVVGTVTIVVRQVVRLALVFGFFAVTFHLLASAIDGAGTLRTSLAVTGWGFLPNVLVGVSGFVVAYEFHTSLYAVTEGNAPPLVFLLLELFPPLMLVVSGYLWYNGMAVTADLEDWEAAAIVGIPVALAVAVTLLGPLGPVNT